MCLYKYKKIYIFFLKPATIRTIGTIAIHLHNQNILPFHVFGLHSKNVHIYLIILVFFQVLCFWQKMKSPLDQWGFIPGSVHQSGPKPNYPYNFLLLGRLVDISIYFKRIKKP